MNPVLPTQPSPQAPPKRPGADVPFGVNEVRLSAGQWLVVALLLTLVALGLPRAWEHLERFDTGADYRIPYTLSKDYWLYAWRLRRVAEPENVFMMGDSVVWGEYVQPDGTWSHFLNQAAQAAGARRRFINAGVNGLFPLALEGLTRHYTDAVRGRKVIVHENLLWLTSPKADLSSEKEEAFNHASLVPQFRPRIPCYRADASARLSAIVERNLGLIGWIGHLQNAYFDQKSILTWTLSDDGGSPPSYPNVWRNPLRQVGLEVPTAPVNDPQRGPQSPRHKSWSANGSRKTTFEWVSLEASLQWPAFQRVIAGLRARGNDVFVVLGPFNEHLLSEESRLGYRKLHQGIQAWLTSQQIPHWAPAILPSELYADASHPLTEGYALLANQMWAEEAFQEWLAK